MKNTYLQCAALFTFALLHVSAENCAIGCMKRGHSVGEKKVIQSGSVLQQPRASDTVVNREMWHYVHCTCPCTQEMLTTNNFCCITKGGCGHIATHRIDEEFLSQKIIANLQHLLDHAQHTD